MVNEELRLRTERERKDRWNAAQRAVAEERLISRALERWKAENPAKVERITCEVKARCLAARLERQLDSTALRLEDEACHSAGEASLFVSTDVETGELQLKEKKRHASERHASRRGIISKCS